MKKLTFLLALMTAVAACKKNKFEMYSGPQIIQFGPEQSLTYSSSYELRDTVKLRTFFYRKADIIRDTVYFDIYALGGLSPEDRSFTLEQINFNNAINALPGKHYVAFSELNSQGVYRIKGDSIHARVPVILLRDASLRQDNVVLQFQIVENKWFKLGESKKLWRRVEFSDKITRPSAWDATTSANYWGKYSQVKHQFMAQQTGELWDQDFMSGLTSSQLSAVTFWRVKLKSLLADYNNAHPGKPLTDEDGDLVLFP